MAKDSLKKRSDEIDKNTKVIVDTIEENNITMEQLEDAMEEATNAKNDAEEKKYREFIYNKDLGDFNKKVQPELQALRE